MTLSPRASRLLVALTFILVLATLLASHHTTFTHFQVRTTHHDHNDICTAWPDPGNIAIAVKTGATEAVERVPMIMRTAHKCAKNVMIFSDVEQTVAGYHLQDILKEIPKAEDNSDWDFYFRLQTAHKRGDIDTLRSVTDPRMPQDLAAWTLDKYKQLHILEELYGAHPNKDFYLMVDADTYVIWPNLLRWISQLNPSQELYLGSPAQVGEVSFAHGGSGILLSQAAMQAFVSQSPAAKWDSIIHDECCGDYVIGRVLKEQGITLQSAWPSFNGENPYTIPFGPSHWCQPVVTMHHVTPREANRIAELESFRNHSRPLTFAELHHHFADSITDTLDDWDNLSIDELIEGYDNFDDCRTACEANHNCFQYSFDGICALSYSIHLGMVSSTARRSGWILDRIKSWVAQQDTCRVTFSHTAGSHSVTT